MAELKKLKSDLFPISLQSDQRSLSSLFFGGLFCLLSETTRYDLHVSELQLGSSLQGSQIEDTRMILDSDTLETCLRLPHFPAIGFESLKIRPTGFRMTGLR